VKGPQVFCRSGELANRSLPIPRQGLTIGRSAGCHVRLQERSVSRLHATFLRTKRGTYLRDEQSSVGTMVNGGRIPAGVPVLLNPGDVIQVGFYQVFEYRE
jgi:pSer/pThr/pTyr-binding forkhead associated (FHA) protein